MFDFYPIEILPPAHEDLVVIVDKGLIGFGIYFEETDQFYVQMPFCESREVPITYILKWSKFPAIQEDTLKPIYGD